MTKDLEINGLEPVESLILENAFAFGILGKDMTGLVEQGLGLDDDYLREVIYRIESIWMVDKTRCNRDVPEQTRAASSPDTLQRN